MSEQDSSEKFGERSFQNLDTAAKKGRLGEATHKHDEEIRSRRRVMVENLKILCQQKNLDRKGLTEKTLGQLMTENPDKFFNLNSSGGVLRVYFLSDISTLRDLVFGEEEE